MKVLVATKNTQGARGNDFCWVPEGQIVLFPAVECDGEKIDGPCGCKRSMDGIVNHKGTTTVMVADNPRLTMDILADKIHKSRHAAGFGVNTFASQEIALELHKFASRFAVGTVLERRGGKLVRRAGKGGSAVAEHHVDVEAIANRMLEDEA